MINCKEYAIVLSFLDGTSPLEKRTVLDRIVAEIQFKYADYILREPPYVDDKYSDPIAVVRKA